MRIMTYVKEISFVGKVPTSNRNALPLDGSRQVGSEWVQTQYMGAAMTKEQAIQFFGGISVLIAVFAGSGVRARTVEKWGEEPPITRQYQLEVLTAGRLRARRGRH